MFFLKGINTVCLAGLLCLILITAARAAGSCPENNRAGNAPLVVAFTHQVFFNVDPRDAIGAARTWIRNVDRKIGIPSETRVVFFGSERETEEALARNEVDILIVIAEDFISLRDRFHLLPVLSADFGKNFYDEILLLVRADSGISNLGQLRGKTLKIEGGQKGMVPRRWLDSVLGSRYSADTTGFFRTTEQHPKASQTIMPVFFGQADACLTSCDSFTIMSDLNPQIGRQLRVLERSPGFVTGFIVVRKGCPNYWRDLMVKALQNSDTEVKGRQILTMFRINRLVPFRPEHLASVEKILSRKNQSKAVPEKRRQRR